jgi:phospholipid/cholesterol/gamma-HCH transport system substrate-binding protein
MRRLAALAVLLAVAIACAPEPGTTVSAVLPSATNLYVGSEARVLGMRVGDVVALQPSGPDVVATLRLDRGVTLPADVTAVITPESLLGERYVQLGPPYQGGPAFHDGGTIPRERTGAPAELDEVLASFDGFLRELDPDGIAELVDVLATALEGQGDDLNALIDNGATTVRVLRDASEDLNAIVGHLADLNESVATRDEQLGRTLEDFTTVVHTLNEEHDDIVEGVANLRRLNDNLRPLTREHGDPLVADLEALATALSTVDRNLTRLGDVLVGGKRLFEGAGRGFDYRTARLRLDDELLFTPDAILLRLRERLVGLCIRLGESECADPGFWDPVLPELLCDASLAGSTRCADKPTLAQAIRDALGHLPPEALGQLETEARQRQSAPPAAPAAPPDDPVALPPARELLPAPDPRLGDLQAPRGLRDRLADVLVGAG